MRQLLEAGVHFGHRTRRWNPKMAPYLFGVRKDIHIIDLQQTVPLLHRAMVAVRDIVAGGGRVLFVGTKRQASDQIAEAAKRCGQYYVNHRWLGGMMTNWRTISNSIKRLRDVEEQLTEDGVGGLTKKETLRLHRERDRLDRALGGIKEMGGLPDVLFVVDTNREDIAVAEANKIGIPVVGVVDSNSNPAGIDYPIPGNDDAIRAIRIYCELVAGSVLDGIQVEITASGGDVGEGDESPAEDLPAAEGETVDKDKGGEAPADDDAKKDDAESAEGAAGDAVVAQKEKGRPQDSAAQEPAGDTAAAAKDGASAKAKAPSAKQAQPPKDKPAAEAKPKDKPAAEAAAKDKPAAEAKPKDKPAAEAAPEAEADKTEA
jgi:small subunit ribosomal protein S2